MAPFQYECVIQLVRSTGLLSKSFGSRGVSPIVVGVLVIVVIVAGVLLGLIFLTGLSRGFRTTGNTGLSSTITAHIYSTDAGSSFLGDHANFTVIITNTVSTPQVGAVELDVGNSIVLSTPFALGAGETKTIFMSQPLNQTGTWTEKIVSNGIKVNQYSFNVFQSQDEADYAITQWESQNFYNDLIIVCFFLSVVAFAISAALLARQPKPIRFE
jgi:hypothetical protein